MSTTANAANAAGSTDAAGPAPAPKPAQAFAQDPILVVHGVGDFADGQLVEDIAQHWCQQGGQTDVQKLRRQTLFVADHRYTLLEDDGPAEPQIAPSNGQRHTRFLEVNWSDIRRARANFLGLLKNFAMVFLALTRLGVYGVRGSDTLARPITAPTWVLVVVETLLFWASLMPALSALLWKLPQHSRLGVCVVLAMALVYLASWLRAWSRPMAAGALWFAVFTLWAGYTACVQPACLALPCVPTECTSLACMLDQPLDGRRSVTHIAGAAHSALVLAAGAVLLLASTEIFARWLLAWWRTPRAPAPVGGQLGRFLLDCVKPLARVACLWLPTTMLSALQPVTVSAVLLSFSDTALDLWGRAFQAGMLFSPAVGYWAAMTVLVVMVSTLVVGALQYVAVRFWGRTGAALLSFGLALGLIMLGLLMAGSPNLQCRHCLRTDWLWVAAWVLTLAGMLGLWVFRQRHSQRIGGCNWHPAGKYARLWARWLLAVVPLAFVVAWWGLGQDTWAFARNDYAGKLQHGALSASDYILQASKFALLAMPLAVKPIAALIDALGDVFFWFVAEPKAASKAQSLSTKLPTGLRFGVALEHLLSHNGDHVLILAHSQGTVIAAHALNQLARQWQPSATNAAQGLTSTASQSALDALLAQLSRRLQGNPQRITLVTLGSPITSLYRNFFGVNVAGDFAQLCQREPQRFAWYNVVRAADYVGSHIELPGVTNYQLGTPGDHVGYWCDRALLDWLCRCARQEDWAALTDAQAGGALLKVNALP